jgi:hypothetical protein
MYEYHIYIYIYFNNNFNFLFFNWKNLEHIALKIYSKTCYFKSTAS